MSKLILVKKFSLLPVILQFCIPTAEDYTVAEPVAGPIITHIIYNEDYILLKCRKPADTLKDCFGRFYYIVDAKTGEIFGPSEKDAFLEKCEELEIGELNWNRVEKLEKMDEPALGQ